MSDAVVGVHHEVPHGHPHHIHPPGILPALQSLLYLLVVALFLMTFTAQPFRIPSESMEPTLLVGDFLLVDKVVVGGEPGWALPANTVRRGDVVVFHYPLDWNVHLVKRVIGLPGDRLHLRHGHVSINGKVLNEPYAVYRDVGPDEYRDNFPRMESANPAVNAEWWIRMRSLVRDGDLTIPAGSYFVMGDNRNDSDDSRYWGLVPRSAIVGVPLVVYFSLREKSADQPESTPRRGGWDFARWERMMRLVH